MNRTLQYRGNAENAGMRIGDFLRSQGYSRHVIIHLKKTEHGILLNGEWAYVGQTLKEGDVLEVHIIEEEFSEQIVARELPLTIIYEDEDLMVINKPADMPIHPSINNYDNTLANALMWYFEKQGQPFVYRCINRLDRDTTGLLIVAKNMLSGGILSDMSKKREIHREYLALAEGKVPESGVIDAPIARKEESVIERCVDFEKGDRAVTHFWRLDEWNGYSLVRLKLETGRTHQIRVHMKYIGHPLTGDYLYNPDYRILDHQALHSWKLAFRHPITGEQMQFRATVVAGGDGVFWLLKARKLRPQWPTNSWNFINMKISADAFDDQIMICKMWKTGHDDGSDDAHFFDTDRETAACGRIFFLIQEPVSQCLFGFFQKHGCMKCAGFQCAYGIELTLHPVFILDVGAICRITENGIPIVQAYRDSNRKLLALDLGNEQFSQLPGIFIGEMSELQDLFLHLQHSK